MPYPVSPPFPFSLPEITFPLHNLKVKSLPMHVNYEYYSDLFKNDFLAILPECFLLFASITVLLYGVIWSSTSPTKVDTVTSTVDALRVKVTSKVTDATVLREATATNDRRRSLILGILGVNTSWMAILSIVFTILLLSNNPISNASIFYSYFVLDDLALFFKMLVLVGTLFSIIISLQYIQQESLNNFELQVLLLISSVSMLFLISSADFISIYLAIELQSLCFYVMAGVKRENEFSTEAGLKYFLLGAFSSGILLFGLALQYGFTGTTHFSELSKIFLAWSDITDSTDSLLIPGISSLRGCELGMIFILVGFLFKLSAVPFHMWAPDVYEGAPTSVTAFFAIVPKVSILAILLRLCYQGCYDFMTSWQKILILSSIASMILGSLAALSQNKIKRLLAWSSIGHVGYLLTAVSCGTVEAIQAVIFYMVIYIVMTISLFQLVLAPMRREKINAFSGLALLPKKEISAEDELHADKKFATDSKDSFLSNRETQQLFQGNGIAAAPESDTQQIKYTTDLAFLSKTNPVLAMTISITMFSIAGIPPLAGFYSKAFLLFAAMSVKQYFLATIVIVTSVISCFYYIRIIKIMYFEADLPKASLPISSSSERVKTGFLSFMRISKETSLVFGITFAILTFFCLNPTPLFTATHFMALSFSQDGWDGIYQYCHLTWFKRNALENDVDWFSFGIA